MADDNKTQSTQEDSDGKKARLLGAMKLPDPPKLPSFSRGFTPAAAPPQPLEPPALPAADVSTINTAATKNDGPTSLPAASTQAASRGTTKPNFAAMRKSAEKRDPVAGKPMAENELIQMTHYLTAKERREFKILTVLNGHSMNEVIRHAVGEYIDLHRGKLPR